MTLTMEGNVFIGDGIDLEDAAIGGGITFDSETDTFYVRKRIIIPATDRNVALVRCAMSKRPLLSMLVYRIKSIWQKGG